MFTKFLWRLFVSSLILFSIVILDKYQYLKINKIKEELNYNINPLNIVNKLNGKLNLIELGNEEETSVSKNYLDYIEISNNLYRYSVDQYTPVNNYMAGVVTKIERSDTITVTIAGIDNIEYIYYNLDSFDYHIYQYLKTNQTLGSATNYYEMMINEN